MTTVPHPEPTTRAEARANAIALMDEREHLHMPDFRAHHLTTAHVWSQIALSFPEEEPTIAVDNYSDFQGQFMNAREAMQEPCAVCSGNGCPDCAGNGSDFDPRPMAERNGFVDPDATAVLTLPQRQPVKTTLDDSYHHDHGDGSIQVSAVAWDALRLLAIRYVLSSINRAVTVDLTDEDTGPRVWDLEFIHIPGSPIVQVTVSRPGDTVTG